jgi:hypothetical protein
MRQEFARQRRELRSGEAVTVSFGLLARTARRWAVVYMLIAGAAPSVEAQGRYRVDASRGTVTHVIEGAMSPDWIGTELVRGYRFRGPNRVELRVVTTAEGQAAGDTVLVWERVRQ